MQLPLFDLPSDWVATSVGELPSWANADRLGLDTETCDPNLHTTGPSVRTGGFIAGASFAIEDGPSHSTFLKQGFGLKSSDDAWVSYYSWYSHMVIISPRHFWSFKRRAGARYSTNLKQWVYDATPSV